MKVWVDCLEVCTMSGGYTGITMEIPDALYLVPANFVIFDPLRFLYIIWEHPDAFGVSLAGIWVQRIRWKDGFDTLGLK